MFPGRIDPGSGIANRGGFWEVGWSDLGHSHETSLRHVLLGDFPRAKLEGVSGAENLRWTEKPTNDVVKIL